MSSDDREVMISVRGLSKAYTIAHDKNGATTLAEAAIRRLRSPFAKTEQETFWALKDVTFDVKRGDVVGIIGRNGAGKSTLFKVLSRITEPTSGQVDLYGRVGSLLEVGTGFSGELTGRENIYLNGTILGMKRSEIAKRFDEIVDFANVEQFLDTPVKRYSSGMYTRLAFAVAAHLDPEILIVDEVLAVGDADFQQKCIGRMRHVASHGRTVLFVSHNMASVQQLCTRAIVLRGGNVAFAGSTAEGVDHYLSGGGSAIGGRIVDNTTKKHESVTVDSVRVNGSESDEMHLPIGERDLTIEMSGSVHAAIRGAIQIRMLDSMGNLIGIFSPAFERGTTDQLNPGPFQLSSVMRLPRMNKAVYVLMFELVLPNVLAWFEARAGLHLHHEGTPMSTGQTFEARIEGALLFDEAI